MNTELAYVPVLLVDDYEHPYPRPDVLEVSAAHSTLARLDALGVLGDDVAPSIRVLLGVVGRLGAGGLAEAFGPTTLDDDARLPCGQWNSCLNHDHGASLRLVTGAKDGA